MRKRIKAALFGYLGYGKVVPAQKFYRLVEANVNKIIFGRHANFFCKKPVEIGDRHIGVFGQFGNGKVFAAMKFDVCLNPSYPLICGNRAHVIVFSKKAADNPMSQKLCLAIKGDLRVLHVL